MTLQPTTLWEYPSQDYDGPRGESHGDQAYVGATPAWVIWNVLQRYSREGDLVVDPMCGSGTTLDVARELGRKALGYDLNPTRSDIFRVDARNLPPELTGKVQVFFMDPPYSTHVDYSDDPRCIGKLDALAEGGDAYYTAMEQVLAEAARVLKPGGVLAIYVSDTFKKGKSYRFGPIGFELFARARQHFEPIDIITVVRHNAKLQMGNYRKAAEEQNFFLRGFNYLMLFRKPAAGFGGRAQQASSKSEPRNRPQRSSRRPSVAPRGEHAAQLRKPPGRGKDGRPAKRGRRT